MHRTANAKAILIAFSLVCLLLASAGFCNATTATHHPCCPKPAPAQHQGGSRPCCVAAAPITIALSIPQQHDGAPFVSSADPASLDCNRAASAVPASCQSISPPQFRFVTFRQLLL